MPLSNSYRIDQQTGAIIFHKSAERQKVRQMEQNIKRLEERTRCLEEQNQAITRLLTSMLVENHSLIKTVKVNGLDMEVVNNVKST